jgi:protein-tyrosine phosphatase
VTTTDPTRIDIDTDPTTKRMTGRARHGNTPFDVPFISQIAYNLWQGGCEAGLVLPDHIKHVVSLYPWERYTIRGVVRSELYVEMYDAEDQGVEQVDAIARWINACRDDDPVLVHCQAGLNRSSLVAARAMFLGDDGHTTGVDRAESIIRDLRSKRSPAGLCNPAFEAEVLSWS